MKPITKSLRFFLISFIILFIACGSNENVKHELVLDSEYQNIESIQSFANCNGPQGNYTTQVISKLDGSCTFIQKQDDSDASFYVQITSDNKGYVMDTEEQIKDTLAIEDIEMIRGHEFHKMHTNPSHFFDDIHYEKEVNNAMELFNAKDRIGNPVSIMYNKKHKLIYKIDMLNPRDTTELIEIIYKKFIPDDFGKMVKEVEIVQAKKDTFYFNFKSIKVL